MTESSLRTTYVLDTSVLLASGRGPLAAFAEHEVVLPLVVVRELEKKRNDPELGYFARDALKAIEALRVAHPGELKTGVPVNDEGGTLRIEVNHVDQADLPDAFRKDSSHDTRILAVAMNLRKEGKRVKVVSQDLPLRVNASAVLDLEAEEYRHTQASREAANWTGIVDSDYYPGPELDQIDHTAFRSEREIEVPGLDLPANTGVKFHGLLATFTAEKTLRTIDPNLSAFDVKGRSAEQSFALAHLLDPEIGVVSLGGRAGTGKTLLALAAGLELVMEKRAFRKIVIFRSPHAVGGQELGHLPGTLEEKMEPWAAAIYDALEAFVTPEVIEEVKARGLIEIIPLTHVRGRTLNEAFVIVDEAQNLERNTILTAISRMGSNSKIALSWDAAQRDNLHVSNHDGMQSVVALLRGEPLFAHVTLTRSERSAVAEMITRVLEEES